MQAGYALIPFRGETLAVQRTISIVGDRDDDFESARFELSTPLGDMTCSLHVEVKTEQGKGYDYLRLIMLAGAEHYLTPVGEPLQIDGEPFVTRVALFLDPETGDIDRSEVTIYDREATPRLLGMMSLKNDRPDIESRIREAGELGLALLKDQATALIPTFLAAAAGMHALDRQYEADAASRQAEEAKARAGRALALAASATGRPAGMPVADLLQGVGVELLEGYPEEAPSPAFG